MTGVASLHRESERSKNRRKTRRQRVAVCVWRCGCLPALAARKQNKRERNVCSAPQALVARPHVTAPSARRSSRPLLMRAAGEAHRAVVMSVSVGVRVEQLGGKHTAPLTGRVQKKQLKEGGVEKKKTSIVIAPKSKKEGMGDEKVKNIKINLKYAKKKDFMREIRPYGNNNSVLGRAQVFHAAASHYSQSRKPPQSQKKQ
ncbi:hypothetical protein ECC02_008262 [Trypanosoma cruzi]|uniref:Uncharacterized protein n=1 Tax=Trypanosoma cruzi TaxID=5693 RepID=A0A7J6XW39_TRYCR|nr:hypothetical protein ECC02_008262 [Trypanosoma cruzi]